MVCCQSHFAHHERAAECLICSFSCPFELPGTPQLTKIVTVPAANPLFIVTFNDNEEEDINTNPVSHLTILPLLYSRHSFLYSGIMHSLTQGHKSI
jgi:hypothetical protein